MARLYGKINKDRYPNGMKVFFNSQSLALETSTFLTLISALSSRITRIQQNL